MCISGTGISTSGTAQISLESRGVNLPFTMGHEIAGEVVALGPEAAGAKIGDKTYDIEIVAFDDQIDPKRSIAGMEKMAQEGIHYVVGPNVDDGALLTMLMMPAEALRPNSVPCGPRSTSMRSISPSSFRPMPERER